MTSQCNFANGNVLARTTRILEIVDEIAWLNAELTGLIRECLRELDPEDARPWLADVLKVNFDDPAIAEFVDAEIVAARGGRTAN